GRGRGGLRATGRGPRRPAPPPAPAPPPPPGGVHHHPRRPIVTRPSFSDTLHRLGTAQKGAARSAPAYSRFVNRRLGRVLAALAHSLGLSADAVTGLSALFTFTGLALVALVPFGWPLGIAVTACLVIGYALDSAD